MEGIQAKSSSSPDDFHLAARVRPGHVYKGSNVLLARAHFSGTLELLTAAWERLLGYGRQEFAGTTLCQLVEPRKPVACLRLHRRFHPYERTVYMLAEETPENENQRRIASRPEFR